MVRSYEFHIKTIARRGSNCFNVKLINGSARSECQKIVQSSKGQILLGGGRIIIDPFARRIHEVARPFTERDRTIVAGSRGFYWFTTSPPVSRKTTPPPPRLSAVKSSPGESIRCQLESARNLLFEEYMVTLLRNNVSRRFVDTTYRERDTALTRDPRELRRAKEFCFRNELSLEKSRTVELNLP